jgi:hypothetical protein
MKKLILTIALGLATSIGAFAQGQFNLSNGAPTVDAPISDANGSLITDTGFWIQAYTGVGPDAASLAPLGTPFRAATGVPGYFFPGATAVPGSAAGETVTVQIAAWSDNVTSYEAAIATPGSQAGLSNPVNVLLAGGTTPLNDLTGLNAFSLSVVPVPEPSVILLGLAGAGMLWFRRKK